MRYWETAITRIKEFEPPDGYYLAFSGGKDSVVIKHLADCAGVKYDAHYSVTTIDPPEVVRFLKKYHPDVKWERPKEAFLTVLAKKAMPTRRRRWCCEKYKENGGKGQSCPYGYPSIRKRKKGETQNGGNLHKRPVEAVCASNN